jgi:transcriptional regulator with XRE-family HTH domain
MARSGELAAFLRSRRASVTPAEVGLPKGPRRRTPGLRRAELATLAGISVDYLTRLEQGRDRRPSAQVLAALADAMRLGDDDRDHLRKMASINNTSELCPEIGPPPRTVRPAVRAVLDQLEPAPAFVLNNLGDLLAWTSTYARLAEPLGILDDSPPNLLRYTFTDPRSRNTYPDWDAVADEQVANLVAHTSCGDGAAKAFVTELSDAAPPFGDRFNSLAVAQQRTSVKRIRHPDVGELRVTFETMQLSDRDGQRLVVYLAADDATAQALDLLAGRHPGALRAVGA